MTESYKPIQLGVANIELQYCISKTVRLAVFKRDHFTCRYCGFRSEKYQMLVLEGDNRRDLEKINTACIFCQQCFAMNLVSLQRSGVLVWLPKVEQGVLNRICQDIYVARISQGAEADMARQCIDHLGAIRQAAKEHFGNDDPLELAKALKDDPDYIANHSLEGIRLWPLDRRIIHEANLQFNQFPQILAYWRSKRGPYANWKQNNNSLPWLRGYADSLAT